jgi:outer membrane biogenesis lipoprotein LolB
VTKSDGDGRFSLIQQHGWTVQIEGRHELRDQLLPRKITATRGGDRVRLLIKDWKLPAR